MALKGFEREKKKKRPFMYIGEKGEDHMV